MLLSCSRPISVLVLIGVSMVHCVTRVWMSSSALFSATRRSFAELDIDDHDHDDEDDGVDDPSSSTSFSSSASSSSTVNSSSPPCPPKDRRLLFNSRRGTFPVSIFLSVEFRPFNSPLSEELTSLPQVVTLACLEAAKLHAELDNLRPIPLNGMHLSVTRTFPIRTVQRDSLLNRMRTAKLDGVKKEGHAIPSYFALMWSESMQTVFLVIPVPTGALRDLLRGTAAELNSHLKALTLPVMDERDSLFLM